MSTQKATNKSTAGRLAMITGPLWLLAAMAAALPAHAAMVTVTIPTEVGFIGEYEYGTAQPLPPGTTPLLLPLFSGAQQVVASFSYDPALVVANIVSPDLAYYQMPGSFTLAFSGTAISVTAGGTIGVNVDVNAGVQVYGQTIDSFTGNLGTATPFGISSMFYSDGLADNQLPAAAFPWRVANLYVDLDGIDPARNIFVVAGPVPEPATGWLLLSGLVGGLAWRRRLR